MKAIRTGDLVLYDHDPTTWDFRAEVLSGLPHRQLPCKYFYDERGSRLFDRICELPEYYPTRTEFAILREHGTEIAAAIGPRCRLIELGSGSSAKVRILLDRLSAPAAYVPVEISKEHMLEAAVDLASSYPDLLVQPVRADYTEALELPPAPAETIRNVCYFPGSTIGNFALDEAEHFLARLARIAGPGGGLVIGADLKKDEQVLLAAYNDSRGVTADFNRNVLRRIRDELGAEVDLDAWEHRAIYNRQAGRVEMQLVSSADQEITLDGQRFPFLKGESITTEYSYKYDLDQFASLAGAAGFAVRRVWTDPKRYFSVQYLEVA